MRTQDEKLIHRNYELGTYLTMQVVGLPIKAVTVTLVE